MIIRLIVVVLLSGFPAYGMADGVVKYVYDKDSGQIYVKDKEKKKTLKFNEDYTGNPSYLFSYFSSAPAIISDGRSLHDFTVYATLKYSNNEFLIDCLYANVKSKLNGILVKEGVCDLGISQPEQYSSLINEKVNSIEGDMDTIDTSLILQGNKVFLPIIIYNSKSKLMYKLYENKDALLNDDYSIIALNSDGTCDVYQDSPWFIYYGSDVKHNEIMNEDNKGGVLKLKKMMPNELGSKKCSDFPLTSVKQPKAYFYDSLYKVKKSYLIKGDKVNILKISDDGKWCKIKYFSEKNKFTYGTLQCADLNF
ncbi:hypothetical protein [Cronobacter dublinensis]|uniref:hypothetical protein n=1 Tax=Cronobacter dublinensis TaxID=413497 RepID=UPI0013758B03|nr:hypothetical protein [Cronobacter dublinensis]NCH70815.1 hypothetical protein [Cronobacter dublinensis]